MNQTFFSIVIPTLNEEKYLPKLIDDLSKQTFFVDKFEVIVIDANSEDRTLSKIEKYKNKINLKTIIADKKNVSYQRNQGANFSTGEWIILMDADNRIEKDFLDGIKYQLAKHPKTQVFTTWIKPDEDKSTTKALSKIMNLGIEMYKTINKDAALGALIGCHNRVTKKIAFDENQKIMEDPLFIQSAIKKGFRFSVFKEPRFAFSFRRLKKEGTLKFAGKNAMMQLEFLQGGGFSDKDFGYKMLGGNVYEEKTVSFLHNIQSLIRNASQKQRKQIKKLLDFIQKET